MDINNLTTTNNYVRKLPTCSEYNKELIIEGYFIRFEKRSKIITEELYGKTYTFTESFAKGSLDKALQKWENGEVLCEFKVDHTAIFNGKLRLSQDDFGGYFTFKMENTKGNKKLWDRVQSGELNETSFAFGIKKNQYSIQYDKLFEGKHIHSRRIFEIEQLKDVSIVQNPAYEGNGVNSSQMCTTGKGIKTKRSVNHYHSNTHVALSERVAEVQKLQALETQRQQITKQKEQMKTTKEKIFNKFTGIPGLNGNVTISEELRAVDTAQISLVTELVDVLVHNNPTNFKNQLETSGLNFLANGKVNRINSNEFMVGAVDEHGEFPAFDDLVNLKPDQWTRKRIGATFIVSNELLASSDFVNSLVTQADNEIYASALGFLINENIAAFTELAINPMTPEFIAGALAQIESASGTFLAKETAIIPQLFVSHGATGNVINRTGIQEYKTASGNAVMFGIDKYLSVPTVSIYGDFTYAFMDIITQLEVVKNHFTYAKYGQTEVTFYREIGIAITDPTKFCKSQVPV